MEERGRDAKPSTRLNARNRGRASTISYLLLHFNTILFSFNSKTLFSINKILSWLLFWIRYLDVAIARYQFARLV